MRTWWTMVLMMVLAACGSGLPLDERGLPPVGSVWNLATEGGPPPGWSPAMPIDCSKCMAGECTCCWTTRGDLSYRCGVCNSAC